MWDTFLRKIKLIVTDGTLRDRVLFVLGALVVFRLLAAFLEVGDPERVGLGFHEPVVHTASAVGFELRDDLGLRLGLGYPLLDRR